MKKIFLLLAMAVGFSLNTAYAESSANLVIEVPIAGSLSTVMPLVQANTVSYLKITGFLNESDIAYLRLYTPLLANLDMSEVTYYNASSHNYTTFQSDAFNGKTSLIRVQMPKQIREINNNAFYGCTSLQRVILPDSLRYIGYYAFQNCTSLDSVILPEKVYNIDYYSFQNCRALQAISLPKGVTALSSYVFQNCSKLKTVTLSDTLTTIYEYTFNNCTSLEQIHLPARLKTINNYAFYNCSSLDSIALPVTLTSIGYQSFASCTSLKSIVLPNSLTSLSTYTFQDCSAMETVLFPPNFQTISNNSFYNCSSLKNIRFPDNLLTIRSYAFYNCSSLKKLDLPNTIQTIEGYAFQYCSKLDTLIFPPSVTEISSYAFANCSSLKMARLPGSLSLIREGLFINCTSLDSVSFPVGLTQIGHYAFSGCNSLKGKLILPALMTNVGHEAFLNTRYSSCKSLSTTPPALYSTSSSLGNIKVAFVPEASVSAYQNSWSGFLIIGGDSVTSVDVSLISGGTLGEAIMEKVAYLKDVHQLTVSGPMNSEDLNMIRQDMPSLVSLNLKKAQLATIPDYQFSNKPFMLEIVLPDSLESFGYQAFYNCKGLTTMTIPGKIRTISNNAFQSCRNLGTVLFTEGLTGIGNEVFYDCYSLQNVVLPQSLENLGSNTFQYCYQLQSIVIPPKVTVINNAAFYNCTGLTEVTFPENLTQISSNAFYDCALKQLNLPDKITLIDDYAFYSNNIKKLVLPAKLTGLGYYSFAYCPLDSVVLRSNLYSIENSAFAYCTSLKDVRCEQSTPPLLTSDPFNGVDRTKCSLTVPYWSANMYKTADIWSAFYPVYTYNTALEDISINGKLVLADNIRFPGAPNVNLLNMSTLTVRGNAPLTIGRFASDISLAYSREYWSGYINLTANFGKVISECPAITASQVNINLNAYGDLWYYLTFPFDVPVNTLTIDNGAQFVFRKYDGDSRASNGTGDNWKTMTTDSVLKAGEGYIYQSSENALLKVIPTDNTKNQLFASTTRSTNLKEFPSVSLSNKSWNFVGNPYPAYFDSRYIDFTAPITVWNYYYSTYNALSLIDDEYVLKPYEAFFVQKPEDMSQISFLPQGRQLGSEVVNPGLRTVQSRSASERKLINLTISNDYYLDKCRVVINPSASLSYELKSDASKFMSSQLLVPQLYSLDVNGIKYAINERPLESGVIRLGCYIGEDGVYTLGVSDLAEGWESIVLTDKLLQKQMTLNNQNYQFSSVKGTFENRFELTLPNTVTHLENPGDLVTRVWCTNGAINIITKAGNTVSVYTLNGILQQECISPGTQMEVRLAKGVYMVKVDGHSYKSVVF